MTTGLHYHPHGHKGMVRTYRLVIEAEMNKLTFARFIHILIFDKEAAAKLIYIPKGQEVHHKDRNCLNDAPDNLELTDMLAHKAEHKAEIVAAMNRFQTTTVVSITPLGKEMTYDLVMEAPHHNFIANSLVAHNCGNYGGCAFAKVCAVSPSHRKAWLESDFMHWHWDPTVARGDV